MLQVTAYLVYIKLYVMSATDTCTWSSNKSNILIQKAWMSLLMPENSLLPPLFMLSISSLMCNWIVSHIVFYPDSTSDVYEGDWVNDLRQGHGIMKFIDGTIYGVS